MLRPTHVPESRTTYRGAGLWRGETLWNVFLNTASLHTARIAIVDGDTCITFGALAERATRLAAGFAVLGVRAGDVVAVQLPNWHEMITTQLALARLGAVINPVLATSRERELAFILRQGGARVL